MNTQIYMNSIQLKENNQVSTLRLFSGYLTIVFEVLSVLFNLLTFYLVRQQNYSTPDMWLATILSLGDALFMTYKLCQLIVFEVIGLKKVFMNFRYGQIDGVFEVFLIISSINCVGFLAFLRFWILYLKKQVNTKIWVIMFLIQELLALSLLIGVAAKNEMILMPFQRYYFPNAISDVTYTRVVACFIILWNFGNLIMVNLCYPLLAINYIHQLTLKHINQSSEDSFYTINFNFNSQRRIILIKTILMLFLYNLCMLPTLVISIKEQIVLKLRSETEDTIIAATAIFICVVNPMILLILHDGIFSSLKNLITNLKFWSHKSNSSEKAENQILYN